MEKAIKSIFDKYKTLFIILILIGFLAHGFVFTNKLLNHDDVSSLFAKGATFELGRWGLVVMEHILPNISMPWFNGVSSLILLTISVCFIVDLLKIENKYSQILIGGIIITFPAIISLFSYMFTSTSYAISILLSVATVKLFISKRKIVNVLGIIFFVFSISIYQGYICITLILLMILLMKDCVESDKSFKEFIFDILKYGIQIIISLGIYYILTKIINVIFKIDMYDYQGVKDMGDQSIIGIINGIKKSYKMVYYIFATSWNSIAVGFVMKLAYILSLLSSLILAIYIAIINLKKDIKKTLIYIAIFFLLPVAANILYIISPKVNIHTLMTYGNVIWFILPIILYEWCDQNKLKSYLKYIIYTASIVVIAEYIVLANEAYFRLYLTYENTYAFYNSLITRIETTEGFEKNTPIALVGKYEGELLADNSDHFEEVEELTGILKNIELINAYSKEEFIKNYIGTDFEFIKEDSIEKIKETKEFKDMNIYPYCDSIKKIDGTIVVKFSEK